MIWVIVLLFFIGLMLIILEAIIPHGLSVIAGLLVIGASSYICFTNYGIQLGTIYLIFSLVFSGTAAFIVFRSGIRYMALHPIQPKRGSTPGSEGSDDPPVGEVLSVIQPLRPTGTVQWRGRRYPARSLRPEIEVPIGASVRLMERDSVYLLVDLEDARQ